MVNVFRIYNLFIAEYLNIPDLLFAGGKLNKNNKLQFEQLFRA